MNFLKKWWGKALIVVIITGLVAAGAYYGYQRIGRLRKVASSEPVLTDTVKRGSIVAYITGSGTVEFADKEIVRSTVSGQILKVYKKKGDEVKEGDLLLELENEDLKFSLERSQNDLQQMEDNLAELEREAANLTVKAPIKGKVEEVFVSKGDEVRSGTVLFSIIDDSVMYLTVPFSVEVMSYLETGMEGNIVLDETFAVKGKIIEIDKKQYYFSGQGLVQDVTLQVLDPSSLRRDLEARAEFTVEVPFENSNEGRDASDEDSTGTPEGTVQKKGGNGSTDSNNVEQNNGNTEGENLAQDGENQNQNETREIVISSVCKGKLIWADYSVVKAKVDGEVYRIYKDEGESVSKGQTVIALKNDSLMRQIESQKIQIEQKKESISNDEEKLQGLSIYSDIDGTIIEVHPIIERYLEKGKKVTVSPSDDLFEIGNMSRMEINIPVDEMDIPRVSVGQKALVTVDAYPDRAIPGVVEEISQKGTSQNGVSAFNVKVVVDNTDGTLMPGMTGTVRILVGQNRNTLLIPIEAVQDMGGKNIVEVIRDGKRIRTPIKIGLYNETQVEVLEGLKEGETVVIPTVKTPEENAWKQMPPGIKGQMNPGINRSFNQMRNRINPQR